MKKIYAFETKCLGCGLCEVYCRTAHSKFKNVVKAHNRDNITSAIVIEDILHDSKLVSHYALQCRHCLSPKCVKACISGAMYKDEKGIVHNDKKRCVGCLSCVLVCSFGAVKKGSDGKAISKCDLCRDCDDGEPLCVRNCPNGAIKLLDESEAEGALK